MSGELNEELDSENQATEEVENTESTELESEVDDIEETDDSSDESEDAEALKEKNRKLFERAKKAEAEVKRLKSTKPKPEATNQSTNQSQSGTSKEEIEEMLLRDKGLDDEAIAKLKAIAKGTGTDLTTARKDDMFIAWESKRAEEKKKADAKLGASRRSGSAGQKKDLKTPGLSDEDHKNMWKEKNGR